MKEWNTSLWIKLYRDMLMAREVDILAEQFTKKGQASFNASGRGHEAVAALNPHLGPQDWLHCHYRDAALMIARGIHPEMFFNNLFCTDASHSRGRQMSFNMADREKRILSTVTPVGNNALQAAGVAAEIASHPDQPIVFCGLGDGTTQEGEVFEAIAEAVRRHLPVLFLIENNHWAISTQTACKTFFSLPDRAEPPSFYGLPIRRVDGRDAVVCYEAFGQAVSDVRSQREPAIVQMNVQRLSNHSNADDQTLYREDVELQRIQAEDDPLPRLAEYLKTAGIAESELDSLATTVKHEALEAATRAQRSSQPQPIFDAKKPLPASLLDRSREYRGETVESPLTMRDAIREVLRQRLSQDPRVHLYGEDIEDPKGDVFGLTRGLSRAFPDQVKNSPLAEATILGVSIGRALAGSRPVAFIQFADFLPVTLNQIICELGSMYWRTDGAWECPVIVMIACGGYRPGLGPFHAQTFESIAAHTPGIDVFMPSAAADAAGLLNAAFESERPTLFFYPKSCLNDRAAATSPDVKRQFVPIGRARIERRGSDLTFVAWGNTVSRCRQAADGLEKVGASVTLIDLRSLSPWDDVAVLDSVRSTRRLIVAHEDNHTCGFGAEVLATVAERAGVPVQVKRITRSDTYVPCNFANQLEVLPSFKRILTAAAELLNLDLDWKEPPRREPGVFDVEAIGTSPSDESVTVVQWHVKKGQHVKEGALLATFEADKAAADLEASVSGEVLDILVSEGESVAIGATLLKLRVSEDERTPVEQLMTQEDPGLPVLLRRQGCSKAAPTPRGNVAERRSFNVGIESVGTALGSRNVSNDAVLQSLPGKTVEDIYRGTGIRSRRQIGPGESALSLALQASQAALEMARLEASQLDMILCSTGTPEDSTPSMACKVLNGLGGEEVECQAHDISAACSGYLYGLQGAYDFLQSCPQSTVLLVTTEVLSPLLDPNDFNTAIIFGDAATATVLRGEAAFEKCTLALHRPELSANGETGRYLRVPLNNDRECLHMEGSMVFSKGVRRMALMLQRVCAQAGITPQDLDWVVPHQASQRILNAVLKRLDLPKENLYSNIEHLGNTSSSTIPLCLSELLPTIQKGQRLGLTAFGGGFTFGACLLEGI